MAMIPATVGSIQQFNDGLSKLAAFPVCEVNKAAALPKDMYSREHAIPNFSERNAVRESLVSFAKTQSNASVLLEAVEKAAAQAGLAVARKPDAMTNNMANSMFHRRQADSVNDATPPVSAPVYKR